MKDIFQYSLCILFILTGMAVQAQNTDSLYRIKKEKDSVYRALRKEYETKDSIYHFDHIKKKSSRIDSLHKIYKVKDSVYRKISKDYRGKDSVYHLKNINRKVFLDSLHYKKYATVVLQKKYADSSHKLFTEEKKLFVSKKFADSLYRKKIFRSMPDSLHRMNKFKRFQSDSLRKLYSLNVKLDSLHKYKVFRSIKLDSMKRKMYLKNIQSDSLRLKKYLQHKKIQLQKFQDTITIRDGWRSRELSMEISCFEGDTVYINNNYKKVIIHIVPKQRLRLFTVITYKEELNERDEAILKKMGIEFSRTISSVTTNINAARNIDDKTKLLHNDITSPGYKELNSESNVKRTLFIELPGNALIFLDTKYAESSVENYVKNINAEITNGSLEMGNVDDIVLKTKYSTVKMNDIKNAALNLAHTKFTACNISTMSVVSTASSVQLKNCITMKMASVGDDYKMESAGSISGSKDFGKFNIETLEDRLDLKGANADLKIKNLSYEAPFIKIDSKYADLKLPLYDQKNYSVYYEGSYGDVNKLSSAIQKLNDLGTIKAVSSVQKDTLAVAGAHKTRYEATAGDISGKHAKVDIVCPFCNVVFN